MNRIRREAQVSRDPFGVFTAWALVACSFFGLVTTAVAAPLIYIWIMGVVGSIATIVMTLAAFVAVTSDGGFFSFLIGQDILKLGFEIVGLIFRGLAEISK